MKPASRFLLLLSGACALAALAAAARPMPPGLAAVADRLIGTPAAGYPFNWGEGVQMLGLMQAGRAAHNARYLDYVDQWARLHEAHDTPTLLDIGPTVPNPSRRGYCGHWSPATAILYLYQDRHQPEHLKLAQSVADFILTGAERSPEGALGHWQGSHQLWVDTLYMACPLLAQLGKVQRRPEYIQDAANQIVVHARHLQDEKTGLIFHMWDWQTGAHSEGFWGRGDGWVLMSLAETLEVMSPRDAKYQELAAIARKLAKGLEATQDADGLAHCPRRPQELPRVLRHGDVLLRHAQTRATPRVAAGLHRSRAQGLARHQPSLRQGRPGDRRLRRHRPQGRRRLPLQARGHRNLGHRRLPPRRQRSGAQPEVTPKCPPR